MRIYIIGNDGITLCREPPAAVNEGEIVVASNEELDTARLSGKRLLALWNALPDEAGGPADRAPLAPVSCHQHDPQHRLEQPSRLAAAQGGILHLDAEILRVGRSRLLPDRRIRQ